jgi:sugar phosphate isomerase/epimerase
MAGIVNRRTFIGASVATALAGSRASSRTRAIHRMDSIGLQLYTVREAMKTDLEGSIAKVAASGYKEVEFAGYFGRAPKDVRAIIDRNGLAAPSCHVGYDVVEKQWPETLEAAHVVGHRYIICPWIDEKQRAEPDGWKRAAELFNRSGEASRKAGIQFGYHNHAFEFVPADSLGGMLPYDFILAQTDPRSVVMELDLCWISVAGKDPLAYFEKYPGRFPLVHVKDWIKDGSSSSGYEGALGRSVKVTGRLADVGQGFIDWKRILAQSEKGGIEHYFVEHDEPASAFESIRISYNYLHNLTF